MQLFFRHWHSRLVPSAEAGVTILVATSDGPWSRCRQMSLPIVACDGRVAVSGDAVNAYVPSAWSVASDSPQVLAPSSCVRRWSSKAVGEVVTDALVLADAAAEFLVVPTWHMPVLAALMPGSALLLAMEKGWLLMLCSYIVMWLLLLRALSLCGMLD